MDGFVRDMSWAECVHFSIQFCDLYWADEAEIFAHEIMEVSKCNIWFFHFGFEAAFEDSFAFRFLQSVYFQQDLENKIFVDKSLAIFEIFLTLEDVLDSFHDVVLIGEQFFCDHLESFTEFDVGYGVGCS